MDSKYIHLIALIVAVFFSGVYLRGESARKSEIKRELKAIEMRQAEINGLIDEINTVTAEKDSLLNLKIAQARNEIRVLNRGDSLTRDSIDVISDKILATNDRLNQLAQQINNVPSFNLEEPGLHSAFVDPDVSVIEGKDFSEIQTFVGTPALDATEENIEAASILPAHLRMAIAFADDPRTQEREGGVIENPDNRSPDIDRWLSAVHTALGSAYCAAFVSFCLTEAGNVELPKNRSAGARTFINASSFHADMCAQSLAMVSDKCTVEVPARIAQRGAVDIRPGSLVIWKRNRAPEDWRGHIGFVIDWEGQKGHTVEGNTSSGIAGNQAEGSGVYLRERKLSVGSWFRITHFTSVVLN